MSKINQLIQNHCPAGVEYKKLEDVLTIKNGRDYKQFGDGDVPVYGSGGIMTYINTAVYDKPSVLIPRKGSLDKLYYVDTPFWNVDTIFYTDIDTSLVEPKYIYYYLEGQHLERLNKAGGVPSLTQAVLNKVQLPVPPLEVQREIVRILDNFTSLTAELQAELQARKKQYEYYRDELLKPQEKIPMVTLGEIGRVRMCKRILKEQTNSIGDVPFYKIGTFGKKADAFITQELFEEYKKKYSYPEKGDILISCSGTIGRTIIFDGKPSYFQDSNIVWLEHDETKVLNKYLMYCYSKQPWKISTGGTISRLYNDNILKAKIPVPSLNVQKRLVEVLDNFEKICSDLNIGLPAEIEARQKQYEYYRDALLSFDNSYFVNVERERERERDEWHSGLIKLWQYVFGYVSIELGAIATVTKLAGYEFTKYVTYSDEGKIIALRGLNVKNGKLDLSDVKYIDKSDLTKLNRSKLCSGDMLFTYVGTIGQVAVIDENDKYYLAPNVALIRADTQFVNPKYMRYFFQTNAFWNTQINRLLQSSSMKNIPMEKIRKFILQIPSIKEQNRVVEVLDRFDTLCNDLSAGLPAEIEARQKQYEYYRDKLLSF